MSRLPDAFDPARPTNNVEPACEWAGVGRNTGYAMCRSGAWPCQRVGSRWLVLTRPFLAMFPPPDSLETAASDQTEAS